jgi:hypothetical protein
MTGQLVGEGMMAFGVAVLVMVGVVWFLRWDDGRRPKSH